MNYEFKALPLKKRMTQAQLLSFLIRGRWGEVETEKGPVDLFPTEPTDEDRQVEETLNHGFKVLPHEKRMTQAKLESFLIRAEEGT